MAINSLQINGRDLTLHKAIVSPLFSERTVLTNSRWAFVGLWLKRNKKDRALFYWEQAQQFEMAYRGLPLQAAPLLLYYSFLNAAKALLSSKAVTFREGHGVRAHNLRGASTKKTLSNEGIKIENSGVLPSLSTYFQETETTQIYSLKDLLLNLTYIHRTYCLTYRSQKEIFLPLKSCKYVYDTSTNEVFMQGTFVKERLEKDAKKKLPATLLWETRGDEVGIRSRSSVVFAKPKSPTTTDLTNLARLHSEVRFDIHYINGVQTLWYAKTVPNSGGSQRRQAVITLAAMHRLSEICRYNPLQLASFLASNQNWLITEFISMSSDQYLDQIASEITGHQFLVPNVRSP